jgi:hypothetical protein
LEYSVKSAQGELISVKTVSAPYIFTKSLSIRIDDEI